MTPEEKREGWWSLAIIMICGLMLAIATCVEGTSAW